MKITLLTIGDELLIGQVLNSNAQWLSEKLTEIGITVTQHLTVGDNSQAIFKALDYLQTQDAIIIGGGLGPTHDDITLEVLSDYFSIPLFYDTEWIGKVEDYFKARNRPMAETNKKQAYLLKEATRIDNAWGTAAGQHFLGKAKSGKSISIFVVPGVPHEVKGMANEYILPQLQKLTDGHKIIKKTILVTGIGESALAQKCAPVVEKIKKFQSEGEKISLAFLPNATEVRLRLQLNYSETTKPEAIQRFDHLVDELVSTCGKDFFGFEPKRLEEVIIHQLKEKNKTLCIAESCTGGLITHRLTQIPGASDVLRGSLVAYQNILKQNELGITQAQLDHQGVVSETTAKAMAEAIRIKWGTDFGIATTGYLGPSGGDTFAPVGTVWVAISSASSCTAKMLSFENHRERNKERGAQAALDLLRRQL